MPIYQDKKEKLKKVNQELASLNTEFGNTLLIARKNGAVLFDDVKRIRWFKRCRYCSCKSKSNRSWTRWKIYDWIIELHTTSIITIFEQQSNQEKIFKASWIRAEKNDSGDTRAILEKIIRLHLKKPKLWAKKVMQLGVCKIKWQKIQNAPWISS